MSTYGWYYDGGDVQGVCSREDRWQMLSELRAGRVPGGET